MWNAKLDEAQAGIKTVGRNINNLRYADDTTLMAESEEELKSLLMKVKEESEKTGLKFNIQKTKIMAFGSITSWQIDGETMETVRDFILLDSKITADGDCSHEIKRPLLLGRKVMTNLDRILKSIDRRSQDGGGLGRGDPFLPYKFIERTIQHRANFTKQLLITSWGHQVPRIAAHCLWKEVGQNMKDKKRDKRARDRDPSREGSLNRGSFQTPGNPLTSWSVGSCGISEGNITRRGKNKN